MYLATMQYWVDNINLNVNYIDCRAFLTKECLDIIIIYTLNLQHSAIHQLVLQDQVPQECCLRPNKT